VHLRAGADGDDGHRAHRRDDGAQTGMIGPLSTILMGVMILGEPFTAWVAAGTVLVLAGIWLLAKSR